MLNRWPLCFSRLVILIYVIIIFLPLLYVSELDWIVCKIKYLFPFLIKCTVTYKRTVSAIGRIWGFHLSSSWSNFIVYILQFALIISIQLNCLTNSASFGVIIDCTIFQYSLLISADWHLYAFDWFLVLFSSCFQLQPRHRITAVEALHHRYFADLPRLLYEIPDGRCLISDEEVMDILPTEWVLCNSLQ